MSLNQAAMDRYIRAALKAGCPRDQVANLCKAGIVLQPQQLRFAAACREADRDGGPVSIGFGGARMGGKSHTMVSVLGADDCQRHSGLKCLLLRKVGTSGKESFEALLPKTIGRLGTWIPSQSLWKSHNGSWIKLGHFQNERDVDKYLGLEYDVIAVEEATTLSASKVQAVLSCCRSPVGSGWRARDYSSTNPGGVGHHHYKRRFVGPYRAGAETNTRFVPATVDDNAFAAPDYRRFLDGLTGWLKRAWRFGDWDIAVGQYFTTFHAPVHVVDPFPVPEDWEAWIGFDYGFTHYTSVHLIARSGDGTNYVIGEHAARGWLPERHADAMAALAERHGRKLADLPIYAGSDVFSKESRGGTIAADYQARGVKLRKAIVDRFAGAAEILRQLGDPIGEVPIVPRLHFFRTCPRVIECLPSLEHDPHRPEDVLKVDTDADGLGGDDAYDSLRYAIASRAGKPSTKVYQ